MKKATSLLMILLAGLLLAVAPAQAEEDIVSMNKASVQTLKLLFEELELPEELAEAIVKHRKESGPFKNPEDMVAVPGMTQDFIEEINPQTMDGDIVYDPDAEPALAPSKC